MNKKLIALHFLNDFISLAAVGVILFWLAGRVDGWAILLIIRTALEGRTLQSELTGYADYAQKVRYRLLPGIW